ncbi:methyltransferase family protein [Amnibacterium flavum]|uniref:Isoprenylcysteine carboxylmethyltransferase family protein n=1 Tax=Amnibacterium flavum TaxID=2173173 RepID=A0A2V1HZT3_9MICO|nr:isoprenylcysteine carboxylmethyltransferase family protein [Amnibacterium flavum]PVZ96384.1 hypothetical protein DDQ50_05695 [Amnibacterium flavum]
MRWGRAYFALQAPAGAAWWIGVAVSPFIRETTLGSLDPLIVAVFDLPLFVLASALAAFAVRAAAWTATVWTLLVAVALAGYAIVTTEAGWGVLVMIAAAGGSVIGLALVVLGRIPTEWIIAGPFAFRPAAVHRPTGHLASTFGQLVLFWGFFLAAVPLLIEMFEDRLGLGIPFGPYATWAGAALLLPASALGIWSAITMALIGQGTPLPAAMASQLVVAGPYRFVRNPMAVAGITQGVAVGLMLSSWLVVGYALIGSVLWNYAVRPLEEADLAARFGEPYRRYQRAVRCWIPRIPEHRREVAAVD